MVADNSRSTPECREDVGKKGRHAFPKTSPPEKVQRGIAVYFGVAVGAQNISLS